MKDEHSVFEMTPASLYAMCAHFEESYGMASANFYQRFVKGEFVGIHDAYRWAGYWTAYLDVRGESGPSPVHKQSSEELLSALG